VKRGTPRHPKTNALQRALGISLPTVIGYLELLFHFTAEFAPQGNIGKYDDAWIEAALGWKGRKGVLVGCLIDTHWVALHSECRLVVHDWHDHADDYIKKKLERAKLQFLTFHTDRVKVTGQTADNGGQRQPRARAVPEPEPEPEPHTHTARETLSMKPNRFQEWIAPWTRVGDLDSALRNYIARIETPEEEAAAFACRDRYLASDEVSRGAIMEPWKFIMQQANCKWAGKWPAKNGSKPAPPTGPTEAMKLAEKDFQEYRKKFGETE